MLTGATVVVGMSKSKDLVVDLEPSERVSISRREDCVMMKCE